MIFFIDEDVIFNDEEFYKMKNEINNEDIKDDDFLNFISKIREIKKLKINETLKKDIIDLTENSYIKELKYKLEVKNQKMEFLNKFTILSKISLDEFDRIEREKFLEYALCLVTVSKFFLFYINRINKRLKEIESVKFSEDRLNDVISQTNATIKEVTQIERQIISFVENAKMRIINNISVILNLYYIIIHDEELSFKIFNIRE